MRQKGQPEARTDMTVARSHTIRYSHDKNNRVMMIRY